MASLAHSAAVMPLGMARMTSLAEQKSARRTVVFLDFPSLEATPEYFCVRRLSSVAEREIWETTSATTALSESNSSWSSSKRRVLGSMRRRTTCRGGPAGLAGDPPPPPASELERKERIERAEPGVAALAGVPLGRGGVPGGAAGDPGASPAGRLSRTTP